MLLTSILKMNFLWDMEDDFGLPDRVAAISIRIFVAKVGWDSMFYIFFSEIFLELSYDTMIYFYI